MALIYIVDDQQVNRRILERLALSIDSQVEVRTFIHPGEMFAEMGAERPDLVVTDYNMPVMNGVELIRKFRTLEDCADIPIIVLTVLEAKACRLEALEAGATDFLNNPVDHNEFLCRARNLLKMHKQQLTIRRWANDLERKLENSELSRAQIVRDNKSRLAQVVDTVPAIICVVDRNRRFTLVNATFSNYCGMKASDIENRLVTDVFDNELAARHLELDEIIIKTGKALPAHEETVELRRGNERIMLVTKAPLCDAEGEVTAVLTTALDITERKKTEQHLHELAHFDALTGLANRFKLNDQMRRELARARRGDRQFALHLLDLDHFKHVNDVRGHHTGDQLLQIVAERLALTVRDVDTVARLGGDEFAIIQTDITAPEDAKELAERIVEAMSEPIEIDGTSMCATGSVGVAIHPADGNSAEELLKSADLAMYRAKANGRNSLFMFSEDIKTAAANQAALEAEIKTGLHKGNFVAHFQPFVTLATGEISGGEALVRLDTGGEELLMPAKFLPLAEDNGDILEINEWMLFEACRQAVTWQEPCKSPLRVAVNLSPIQFRRQNVLKLVQRALDETGLPPTCLELELTESIVMQNTGVAARIMRDILDLGVSTAIDDFGTGYSSL
ncbi:MAG: diguanylate cyclase domain-containing protein, partial [Alphaproteobacteria bacterium]